ncbi:MAG: AraC family transcriptional regulator [Eubacteriales bacterium]
MNYEHESIKYIEGTSLRFFFISLKHRLYHWHNDIEILLVVDGSVILKTWNKKYRLSKNDIFILNSNEVHSLFRTNEDNIILVIQFNPKFCNTYFPQLQRIYFKNQHIKKDRILCWSELRKYMVKIVKESHRKEKCYKLKLMSTLNLMICNLIEKLDYEEKDENELSTQQKNIERLNNIILYIKENYMKKIYLKDIAEEVNLDMYYLSHFIKEHLGISFQEYLNKVRLEKAVELLMTTDLNNLDICLESGFSDYRYLNKMFLKEFGCTPSEYKEKNKKPERGLLDFQDESQIEVIHQDNVVEMLLKTLE